MSERASELSPATEDYAKAIFALQSELGAPVGTTAVAERLGVSPASASAMLRRLDEHGLVAHRRYHGVELTPAGRRAALTPAGQSLLRHARTILAEIEHMKSELQRFGEGVQGSIRVFANTTAVTEFMPEVLATFLAEHPKVDVDLQERPTAEIIRGVLDGTTDLGITSGPIGAEGPPSAPTGWSSRSRRAIRWRRDEESAKGVDAGSADDQTRLDQPGRA